MLRPLITALFCILTTASLFAHETAEELVASRTRADVNYQQMMETMGSAAALITEGIIRQNPLTVQRGVEMIDNHPAPNHKPWAIVTPADQDEFKRTLITHDQLLHTRTGHIARAAAQQNWQEANRAASALFETCIACHATWKHRVRPQH